MKLLNISFTKPRYWVLGLAAAAGAGTASAQFTGIGTTAPGASLHVKVKDGAIAATDTTTTNVLQVEHLRRTEESEETTYTSVMVIDPTTGIVRRRGIDELLKTSGEWIVLDEGTATERIVPRRYASAIDVNASAVNIGVATAIGSTLDVTGATDLASTLDVSGATTLGSTLDVTGATDLASTLDIGTVAAVGTDFATDNRILLVQDGGTRVQHVTVEDLVENAGFWEYTSVAEDAIRPRDSDISGTMTINNGDIDVTGRIDVSAQATVGGTLDVTGATVLASTLNVQDDADFDTDVNVDGALTVGTVANAAPPVAADKILIQQDGADLVEHVTVSELLQNNGEWRVDDVTTPTYVYAFRAEQAGNDVTITEANGRVGIGTTTASDKLQIVGGGIDLDTDQGVSFGAIGAISGDGANLDITSTGSVDIASTGVTTIISNGGNTVTINDEGVGIGVVAGAGRVLQTDAADGVQFGSLTQVTNLTTDLGGNTAATTNEFDNVLVTDDDGVIRSISAADLVQESGEWRYEDAGTAGTFDAGDYIYAFRAFDDDNSKAVVVDFDGQFGIGKTAPETSLDIDGGDIRIDGGEALQWDGAANQITDEALTVDGGYAFNTAAASDVTFTETGAGNPWLHFAAADVAGDKGRVGIGTATPLASLHVAGNIVASHTAQTSDKRFKKDITDFTGALEAVKALRGVSYDFRAEEFPDEKFDDAKHLGFIAQEIREVLPEVVFERADGYLTVDYSAVTPVLAEAVEELALRVERLEAENAALRQGNTDQAVGAVSTKQLQELEARLAAMDARLEAATAGRK